MQTIKISGGPYDGETREVDDQPGFQFEIKRPKDWPEYTKYKNLAYKWERKNGKLIAVYVPEK